MDENSKIAEKVNFLIDIISCEIEAIKSYLLKIGLSINDFSSSFILELTDFISFIMNKKHLLPVSDTRNLIFSGDLFEKNYKENKVHKDLKEEEELKFYNFYVADLICKLENLNKSFKPIKTEEYIIQTNKDINNLKEKIDVLKRNSEQEIDIYHLGNKEIIDNKLNDLNKKKKEISKLKEYKILLLEKKQILLKNLQPFESIPCDINLLKKLVEVKKLEYNNKNNSN